MYTIANHTVEAFPNTETYEENNDVPFWWFEYLTSKGLTQENKVVDTASKTLDWGDWIVRVSPNTILFLSPEQFESLYVGA